MFVASNSMQVLGQSPRHNVQSQTKERDGLTKLQFLGSIVDEARKRKLSDSKQKIKGILKNADSMPNLANSNEKPKIANKRWRTIVKNHKYLRDNNVRKSVKFNDPVSRIGQTDSKYKLSIQEEKEGHFIRKDKKLKHNSTAIGISDEKQDSSNVLITVVYDLKIKDNNLLTTKEPLKINNSRKHIISIDTDNLGRSNQEHETQNVIDDETGSKTVNSKPVSSTDETFLSFSVEAPSNNTTKNTNQLVAETDTSSKTHGSNQPEVKTQTMKPKDGVVVTRSRAKPIMFTRCATKNISVIADDPVHITTNFCDDEKTSHIMQWLNDVKTEQERGGFCTLLISDRDNKY